MVMNILFLSSNYYPQHNANSKCLANIAEELAASHNVTVISLSEKGNQSFVHNGVTVIKSPTNYVTSINNAKLKYNGFSFVCVSFILKFFYIVKNLFSHVTCDLDKKNTFLKAIENKLDSSPDVIIPVCFPIEAVIAGLEYKKSNSDVILLPYLLDKYSDSKTAHRLIINKWVKFKKHLSIEKDIIDNSDSLFVYDSWFKHIEKYFPRNKTKLVYVEHPLIKESGVRKEFSCNNILYAGALSRKIRSPIVTFEIISRLLDEIDDLHFDLYSTGDCQKISKKYALNNSRFFDHGHLDSDAIQNKMANSKYLLLIGNSDISQLQSKVFEYMSLGKPIILIGKNRLDPIYKILKKYNNCCCVLEEDKLDDSIGLIKKFILKDEYKIIRFEQVYSEFYSCTPHHIATEFESTFNKFSNKIN